MIRSISQQLRASLCACLRAGRPKTRHLWIFPLYSGRVAESNEQTWSLN